MKFTNKTYLILDPVDTFREDKLGDKIITGHTGNLYAISDEDPKDMQKFREAIQNIVKKQQRYGILDDFTIKDSVMW